MLNTYCVGRGFAREDLREGTYQLCNSEIYQIDINMECKFNKF